MLRLTLFGGFSAAGADGTEIALKSQKARALLAYLALPPGKSRSREEVMALLWSERGEAQARASLRQVLTGLRKDLGEQAMTALNITDDAVSLDPGSVTVAVAKAGEELLAGFHLHDPAFEEWLRDERLRLEDTVTPDTQSAGPPLPDKPSIAVLPFTNMSGDPEQEYFADGITEDIITELSRFRSLFVIARNSSFVFKGQAVGVGEIGRKLGVHYVVEGSVRKVGNRVRITAQLVEAATGNHLWAERYDRDLEDIFAVQDEVVREIASAVPGHLDAAALQRIQRRPIENLTAYDLVLRGEQLRYQDWSSREAITLFEKAIEVDPQCARAYSHLANGNAYSILARFAPTGEARRLTRSFAERAIQFDPHDPVILALIADAYLMVGDPELARRCIEKAIKLNPNDYVVMALAGIILVFTGDIDEGLRWIEKLVRHDPLSFEASHEASFTANYLARRYDDAIGNVKGWRNPPTHLLPQFAATYAQLGRMDEAQAMRRQYESNLPEGYGFNDFLTAQLSMCARQKDRDNWLDGFRKAGFEV